jgi:D-alanyl-D-alanine carboxypeptidase (penicillin-binding protein 5/6)
MKTGLYAIIVIVLGVLGVNLFFWLGSSPAATEHLNLAPLEPLLNDTHAYVFPLSEPSYLPLLDTNVRKPQLGAKAAIAYDVRSARQLYSQSSRQRLPVASLTKVMTASIVLDTLNLNDIVTVASGSLKVDGEVQDLYEGEEISVGNLLKYMLVKSSNDSAYTLAAYAQVKGIDMVARMNERAQAWGLSDTHFLDPAGLNDDAYSTADDMARLVEHLLKYRTIWDALIEKKMTIVSADGKITHQIENTDELLDQLPNIIGGKTGYTEKALGCMILIVNVPEQHDTMIYIVLGSTGRFEDTKKLVNWVNAAYRWE